MPMKTRSKIRQAILNQHEPFCNKDIVLRLKNISKDEGLILNVLDELYSEGLIDYTEQNNGKWCWIII